MAGITTTATLLVVATLITELTYQLGTNLPGGYYQDDSNGHVAGDSILRDKHRNRYWVFMTASWMGFGNSMLMTLALLTGVAVSSRLVRWPFAVAYSSLVLAFISSQANTWLVMDLLIWLFVLVRLLQCVAIVIALNRLTHPPYYLLRETTLSHGLGANAAWFGPGRRGDLSESGFDERLGRERAGSSAPPGGVPSFGGLAGARRRLRTCTKVGSEARPDPSDDPVSGGGGGFEWRRAGQYLSWRLTLPLGLRGEPYYRRVWARLDRRAPLPRSSTRSQMLKLLAESW